MAQSMKGIFRASFRANSVVELQRNPAGTSYRKITLDLTAFAREDQLAGGAHRAPLGQGIQHDGGEGNIAATCLALWLADPAPVVGPLPHMDGGFCKIDIAPTQPTQFAHAHSGEDGSNNQGTPPNWSIVHDDAKLSLGWEVVFLAQWSRRVPFVGFDLDAACNILSNPALRLRECQH